MNSQIESTIIDIIRPHTDFAITINQYGIADEYMTRRGEHITPRTVRKVIESLIEQGYPIISTSKEPGGYCYQGEENEALQCYKRLRHNGIKILLRARNVLRNSRQGQQVLFKTRG